MRNHPPTDEEALTGHRWRVGIDIVAVERVRRLLQEQPGVAERTFTPRELERARGTRRPERLAGRFAAKEAVLKAFGTGLGPRMRWTDVEILNERAGRPRVELHGHVAEWAHDNRLAFVDVSLSHSAGLAVAHSLAVYQEAT